MRTRITFLLLAASLLIPACSNNLSLAATPSSPAVAIAPSSTSIPPTATNVSPSATPTATISPTIEPTFTPSNTPPPSPTPTRIEPSPTPLPTLSPDQAFGTELGGITNDLYGSQLGPQVQQLLNNGDIRSIEGKYGISLRNPDGTPGLWIVTAGPLGIDGRLVNAIQNGWNFIKKYDPDRAKKISTDWGTKVILYGTDCASQDCDFHTVNGDNRTSTNKSLSNGDGAIILGKVAPQSSWDFGDMIERIVCESVQHRDSSTWEYNPHTKRYEVNRPGLWDLNAEWDSLGELRAFASKLPPGSSKQSILAAGQQFENFLRQAGNLPYGTQ